MLANPPRAPNVDGVIDSPSWTFDYGFDPKTGEAIATITDSRDGILLDRTTYELFEPRQAIRRYRLSPRTRSGTPQARTADGGNSEPFPRTRFRPGRRR